MPEGEENVFWLNSKYWIQKSSKLHDSFPSTSKLFHFNHHIFTVGRSESDRQTGQSYPGSTKTRCRTGERQILVYCVGDACHQNSWEQLKCVWSVFYPIVLNWIFVVLKVNSRSWILKKSSVSNRIKLQLRLAG